VSAYFIVRCNYHNMDDYNNYAKTAAKTVFAFNGKFLVTGKEQQIQKETGTHPKSVIVEFETMEKAVSCYESETYQQALSFIERSSDRDFVIVEGLNSD
ncbi:uncharacterized protein METZ01_LOCUS250550, partial [marine metagenome]